MTVVVDDILAHHGVKGQRWGVTRDRSHAVTVTERSGNRTVKTTGGHDYRATADAKKAAKAKQVAKKNSTDALTNKQLKDAIERMRLEQQFKDLSTGKKNEGQKFVEQQLKQHASQSFGKLAAKYTAKFAFLAAV